MLRTQEAANAVEVLGGVLAAMEAWPALLGCPADLTATTSDDRRLWLVAATEMEAAAVRLRGLAVDGEAAAAVVHFAGFMLGDGNVCANSHGDDSIVVGLPARVTCRVCAERLTAMGRR